MPRHLTATECEDLAALLAEVGTVELLAAALKVSEEHAILPSGAKDYHKQAVYFLKLLRGEV